MTSKRPNILWICTDQQRYDTIHALGNEHIQTPNLDRLCAEGVAFTHAHCQSAICTPSRSSFLTGLYPSTVHGNRNGNAYFPTNERVQLITKRLADAGYDCGLSGKLHLASAWNGEEQRVDDGYRKFWYSHSHNQGIGIGNQYTDWLTEQGIDLGDVFQTKKDGTYGTYRPDMNPQYHQTTWCADRAIEFIESPHDGPWLMSVNPFDPHGPFDAPDTHKYNPGDLPPPLFCENDLQTQTRLKRFFAGQEGNPPGDREQHNKASYYGMIALIDENVGRMLNALERTGQRENTVVIFTSDHGEMLGDHGLTGKGCRFYEALVRVPLIISWPGTFLQGHRANGLTALLDIAPTLADLAGIPLEWTHGKSLLPILTGEDPGHAHHEFVRCEYYDVVDKFAPHASEKHKPCWATMLRNNRYKLVVYHNEDYGELYDLREDPDEFHNLWEDPSHTDLKYQFIKQNFDHTVICADPGPKRIGRY